MKQHQKEDLKTRRDFIRQTSCAALGVTGLVNALAHLRLMTAAMAQGGTDGGYKALVFLFLNGGNDSNNMIVPAGDKAWILDSAGMAASGRLGEADWN